jgi:hypothetical protein
METLKQANYALKTESVKNRIVCNDLNNYHTSGTLKKFKNEENFRNWHKNTV